MRKVELRPLTGIRFYAILLVFATHVTELPGLEHLRLTPFCLVAASIGVSVFFVLSGFILTYNYAAVFEGGVTKSAWGGFVWNRLAKIYPMHLLTLLVALPLQILSPNLPLDWRSVPIQLLLVQCFLPFGTPPLHAYLNAPSWSISCEFFFYLLAPFAICWLGRSRTKAFSAMALSSYIAVLVFSLSLLSSQNGGTNASTLSGGEFFAYLDHRYLTYYFAPTRFLEFLGGILIAFAYLRETAALSPLITTLLASLAILFLTVGAWMQELFPWPLQYGVNFLPGGALLIYVLARGDGWVVRHLGSKHMQTLGMASFSFYLIHMPVFRCVRGVFRHFNMVSASSLVLALTVAATFAASQVLALLLFYYFEVPAQRRMKSLVWRTDEAGSPAQKGLRATERA